MKKNRFRTCCREIVPYLIVAVIAWLWLPDQEAKSTNVIRITYRAVEYCLRELPLLERRLLQRNEKLTAEKMSPVFTGRHMNQ